MARYCYWAGRRRHSPATKATRSTVEILESLSHPMYADDRPLFNREFGNTWNHDSRRLVRIK